MREWAETEQLDVKVTKARTCKFRYRGLELHLTVEHSSDEIEIRVAALCKERGIALKKLPELFVEDVFPAPAASILTTDDACFARYVCAREMANAENELVKPHTGELTKAMLQDKKWKYIQADDTFVIELGIVDAIVSGMGAERLKKDVLATLPSEAGLRPFDDVLAAIEVLQESKMYKLVARDVQNQIKTLIGAIAQLKAGVPPELDSWNGIPWLKEAKAELGFFFTHEVTKGTGQNAVRETLAGDKGLCQYIDDMKKLVKNGAQPPCWKEIKSLEAFGWLLSAKRTKEAKEVVAGFRKAHPSYAETVTAEGPSSKRRKTKKSKTDDDINEAVDVADVDALFS